MLQGYRRLRVGLLRNFLPQPGITATSLGGKALDAAGIPADSSLRLPESIYYDSDIRELSGSGSPPLEQPVQVSKAPTIDQAPPAPVEVPTDSRQDDGQGKKVEAPQVKDKNQDKGKGQASDTAVSQSKQVIDPEAPKAKAQDTSLINTSIFFVYCFCMFFFFFERHVFHPHYQ